MPGKEIFEGKTDDEVAAFLARMGPGSPSAQAALAEFTARQMTVFREQAESAGRQAVAAEREAIASERAADATVDVANHTKRYTLYMLASVVISVIALLVALFT